MYVLKRTPTSQLHIILSLHSHQLNVHVLVTKLIYGLHTHQMTSMLFQSHAMFYNCMHSNDLVIYGMSLHINDT